MSLFGVGSGNWWRKWCMGGYAFIFWLLKVALIFLSFNTNYTNMPIYPHLFFYWEIYSVWSNSQSFNNIESLFTLSSYFLVAGSPRQTPPKKGSKCFSLLLSYKERGELSMNHPVLLPCPELCLPFVKQREWWKWWRRHLPWTTADREEEKEGEKGRERGALPDGKNTQRGNKLAETITYSDRPGGAVLLAGRRVGPEHGPPYLGWMGLSLGTKLILGV